ncbi:hypothetical protein BO82DRAFT_350172 [Aspergillus uvarum CBS 121591]|uniref:Uncharacterized protein n=1 Tax=Aspergillus uvarum CBS 121591 TaxID=1448315 RepID=A0A319DEE4_9EURO|nr:hypothetical protein BO82DRAFT_350172 [Aspergillus uvarum CBS 121591]PYH86468.1 hypothetical protein BO82DRAFT_350172 [Aspergillus uvarum CBS 121591]
MGRRGKSYVLCLGLDEVGRCLVWAEGGPMMHGWMILMVWSLDDVACAYAGNLMAWLCVMYYSACCVFVVRFCCVTLPQAFRVDSVGITTWYSTSVS